MPDAADAVCYDHISIDQALFYLYIKIMPRAGLNLFFYRLAVLDKIDIIATGIGCV